MGALGDRVLENLQTGGLSMPMLLLVIVVAGLIATAYTERVRRHARRVGSGSDERHSGLAGW